MNAILNVLSRVTGIRKFALLKMPAEVNAFSILIHGGTYKDWLQVVKGDKYAAYCKLCCREFKLASKGKQL